MPETIEEVTARGSVYVIAEIGQNHNGSIDTARALILAAGLAGANAVKGQKRCMRALFNPDELDRPYSGEHAYGCTYGEHREALEFPIELHVQLREYALNLGIEYSLSVWDPVSAKQATDAGMPWLKLPSACLTWQPLLETCALYGKPLILSTGMSTDDDVTSALDATAEAPWVALLQCTSSYPSRFEDIDLRVLASWREDDDRSADAFGLSGHHQGIAVDCAAVALGATVIERHLTLDRTMKGTDHAASLEAGGFGKLVRNIRATELAMGQSTKRVHDAEVPVAAKLRTRRMTGGA